MFVINEATRKGAVRMRYLPFEGFCEAIVRLSHLLPLPTDAEIAESDFDDAPAFLEALLTDDDEREKFEASHHMRNLELQPAERCVAHTIDFFAIGLPAAVIKKLNNRGALTKAVDTVLCALRLES